MTIDINSGHVDWCVVDKKSKRLVEVGRINCYRIIDAPSDKTKNLLYEVAEKIGNIAEHHNAEVVGGKLSSCIRSNPRANRMIRGMCQYRLRQILRYKLPLRGVPYRERSEARTSKVGEHVGRALGLDGHKGAAYAFAIKVLDYRHFKFLCSVLPDEDDGSSRHIGLSTGSGLTAHIQSLASDDSDGGPLDGNDPKTSAVLGEATPRQQGRGGP